MKRNNCYRKGKAVTQTVKSNFVYVQKLHINLKFIKTLIRNDKFIN